MKYSIQAQADGQSADIQINDVIGDWLDSYFGFGVTSKQFIKDLKALPDSVTKVRLHINSPGGDVTAANHIASTIRDEQDKGREFEALVEGAAFSAATIITSAAKTTKMADNALMMIHDPWSLAVGNARELRKQADVSDKFRDSIIAAYKWKTPLSEKKLQDMMAEETWMDADDAVKNGFADGKIGGVSVSALVDVDLVEKLPGFKPAAIPEQYRARVMAMLQPKNAPTPDPKPAPDLRAQAKEITELCEAAGIKDAALEYFNLGLTPAQVRERLKDASAIRDACTAAFHGNAELAQPRADKYVRSGMMIDEVRAELAMMQNRDDIPIDNKHAPQGGDKLPAKLAKDLAEVQEIRALWRNGGRKK